VLYEAKCEKLIKLMTCVGMSIIVLILIMQKYFFSMFQQLGKLSYSTLSMPTNLVGLVVNKENQFQKKFSDFHNC